MISIRHSPDRKTNEKIKEDKKSPIDIKNSAWLSQHTVKRGEILLLGGNSVAHFRLRVAQSHLRHDLFPSPWSLIGILDGKKGFYSVPLDLRQEASTVPCNNGVEHCRLADYDRPDQFPNIAILRFTSQEEEIVNTIKTIKMQRSIIDLPHLMLPWLGFIWSAGKRTNPLFEGQGLPSAAFVEAVYGLMGVELTPGLASASSCPEAVWQSARWWTTYYEETSAGQPNTLHVPTGDYLIRQPHATPVKPV